MTAITIEKISKPTNGGTLWTGWARTPRRVYQWLADSEGRCVHVFTGEPGSRYMKVIGRPPARLAAAVRAYIERRA